MPEHTDRVVHRVAASEGVEDLLDRAGESPTCAATCGDLLDRTEAGDRIEEHRVVSELGWGEDLDPGRYSLGRKVFAIQRDDGASAAHHGRTHDVLIVGIRQAIANS